MIDLIIPATQRPEVVTVLDKLAEEHRELLGNVVVVDFCIETRSINSDQVNIISRKLDLHYVCVEGLDVFNKSLAINIGYEYTRQSYVSICDADVIPNKSFFQEVKAASEKGSNRELVVLEHVVESANGERRAAPGICAVSRQVFEAINGYCSEYKGWGREDRDFLRRAMRYGVTLQEAGGGIHLSHDNDKRTRCYGSKSLDVMAKENREFDRQRENDSCADGTRISDVQTVSHRLIG